MSSKKNIGLTLMACLVVGVFGFFFAFRNGTLALFTDKDTAVNEVKTGKMEIEIEEEIKDGIKYNVGATNTGNVDAYIRLMVTIPDNQYLEFVKEFHNANADKTSSIDWYFNSEDNYWYLNSKLASGETAMLYDSIKAVGKGGVSVTEDILNKYGDVIVYVEAVQADNMIIPDGEEHPAVAAFEQMKKEKSTK